MLVFWGIRSSSRLSLFWHASRALVRRVEGLVASAISGYPRRFKSRAVSSFAGGRCKMPSAASSREAGRSPELSSTTRVCMVHAHRQCSRATGRMLKHTAPQVHIQVHRIRIGLQAKLVCDASFRRCPESCTHIKDEICTSPCETAKTLLVTPHPLLTVVPQNTLFVGVLP